MTAPAPPTECRKCGWKFYGTVGDTRVKDPDAFHEADLHARIRELEKERDEARAENESAQAAWETRYSILVAALVSIAGSDTIGVHSEYIRMKAEARRVLEGK